MLFIKSSAFAYEKKSKTDSIDTYSEHIDFSINLILDRIIAYLY